VRIASYNLQYSNALHFLIKIVFYDAFYIFNMVHKCPLYSYCTHGDFAYSREEQGHVRIGIRYQLTIFLNRLKYHLKQVYNLSCGLKCKGTKFSLE
jgi:hypothetical protein